MGKKYTPIAMRCTKEQFDKIKPKLEEARVQIKELDKFRKSTCLFNYFRENCVSTCSVDWANMQHEDKEYFKTWNEQIFLEACRIKIEKQMKITKENIIKLDKKETTVRELFPDVFKVELKLNKWYTCYHYGKGFLTCITQEDKDEHKGYGFALSTGGFHKDLHFLKCYDYGFEEATNEEAFEALKGEAVKRYKVGDLVFDEWSQCECKINECTRFVFEYDGLFVLNNNNSKTRLLHNGKWATIIPVKEMTQSQIENELGYKIKIVK